MGKKIFTNNNKSKHSNPIFSFLKFVALIIIFMKNQYQNIHFLKSEKCDQRNFGQEWMNPWMKRNQLFQVEDNILKVLSRLLM